MALVQLGRAASALSNGTETAVSSSAVQVIAANLNRRKLILQNTGLNNVRIGASGVTATTGMRLGPGLGVIFEAASDMSDCPTNAIFAIRETADSTVFAQEVA